MGRIAAAVLALAALAPKAGAAAAPGDPVRGRERYEALCSACHSPETNRIGPRHAGVVGRKAGSVPGFAYSPAVRKLGIIWTPDTLDRWLSGPTRMAPGTRMGLSVSSPKDRADLIAYLATLKP